MLRSQKSKRVTWAFNLCQVRQFSSSEPPSKVGMATHQANSLRPVQSRSRDDMPPGFEAVCPAKNLWGFRSSQILPTRWRCPPKFEVNSQWQVVAGEESEETKTQNRRKTRVLEAIYPRPSTIPPNPCAILEDVENSSADDQNIHVAAITPIEDHNVALEYAPSFSSDQRYLIDYDLVARILSNPKMVQHLTAIQSARNIPSTTTQFIPNSSLPPKIAFNRTNPALSAQMTRPAASMPAKDINYYRSLIQLYGGEIRDDDVPPQSTSRSNSFRGCSAYQHDPLGKRRFDITEVQSLKRVKLN